MDLLLDSHVLLWLLEDSPKISLTASQAMEDKDNRRFVSIATLWEIAIKSNLGKLQIPMSPTELEASLLSDGFQILPISAWHIQGLQSLPYYHRATATHSIECSQRRLYTKTQHF